MNPELWGPKMWFYIHTLAINYPDNPSNEDRKHYYNFFYNIRYTLPCGSCRRNYNIHLNEIPIKLDSKMHLFNWTVDMHNKVNELLGKPILSYSEAISIYTEVYRDQYKNNNIEYFQNNTGLTKKKHISAFIIVIVILILIIVILSVLLFKKRGK
tara:strand:- start:45 stop:509 length:465 start_codon:yes stop_codon:yes gene_type:complete